MANCKNCGRELPELSWGAAGDLCADCRRPTLTYPNPSAEIPPPAAQPQSKFSFAARREPVTVALVAANVAVFVLTVLSGISPLHPTVQQLLRWGANWGPLSLGAQPWRMLTSNYLHVGIIHLFFNMWCLWNLGALAERVFDRWTYFLVYALSGFGGSMVSLWWHPKVIGAGASGAIFGLAGALIATLYLGKLPIPKEAIQKTLRSLLLFAGYNLFFGLSAGIDNSAHLGGLLTGLAAGALLARRMPSPEQVWKSWRNRVLLAIALVLLAGAVYLRSEARKKAPSTLYFEPSSFSSASCMRSTTCPRIAQICCTPAMAAKLAPTPRPGTASVSPQLPIPQRRKSNIIESNQRSDGKQGLGAKTAKLRSRAGIVPSRQSES
jgi:rhomboid protease GluP